MSQNEQLTHLQRLLENLPERWISDTLKNEFVSEMRSMMALSLTELVRQLKVCAR